MGKPTDTSSPHWSLSALLSFRFAFVYLSLFALATQISGSMIPNLSFYYRGMGRLFPMREITLWVARHTIGVISPDEAAGGGEPAFFWVQTFWLLIVALVATVIWSLWDRRRKNYVTLHKWFRLFVRLALAAAMFEYGFTKIIPTQFPPPSLETLVTPTGDLTLSAMLWASIGAAPAYEIFTGCIEVLGGILLLMPRTTMLGAAISFAAMLQVFVLNMTYDIGLKVVSFHILAFALFLLAPDICRFVDFFLRDRAVGPSTQPQLFASATSNRAALIAQLVFGLYLIGMYTYINVSFWSVGGPGSPKSMFYGIWDVEDISVDGQVRVPQDNDYDRRWRRVIFDRPDRIVFQRTDDSFARYDAHLDYAGKTLALTKLQSKTWKASFLVEHPSRDRLILDGEMDGYKVRTRLRLVEFDTMRLLSSSFRWVRPHD